MTETNRTFAELRVDAAFLNHSCANEGLPEPIPNYASMRKEQLEEKVAHHEKDIDAYLAEYGFVVEEK